MKLKIFIIIIAIAAIYSCEEDLNPNAEFLERNVLTCVISSDTNYQVLTLAKSYSINGLDPYENKVDPSIKGAEVIMWYNDQAFQFHDTTIERTDNSRYDTPVTFYYNNNIRPAAGQPIEVEALLPNGILLRATTTVPPIRDVLFSGSDKLITLNNFKNHVEVRWTKFPNLFYHPVLVIKYYDKNTGDSKLQEKIVPTKYINNGNSVSPIFTVPSANYSVTFDQNAIDNAMREISEEDPVKSNYSILDAELKLMIFDENLSAYYSSVSTFLDGYTIKVDQPDFTNVNGGFGIFGSCVMKYYKLNFTEEYVESFGYTAGITGF
ncbi:MAG: hypothetical protein A2068_10630 [Ignavibacteria bacterium GWB2_35_6b]|nr:MAG: hypothetical protein A2068_10630 [Ignavibacteria bacterium GWB2_35_6b]